MPQLVKLQDDLRDSGFLIIGPHSQAGTAEEVTKVAQQLKMNFTVTDQAQVPGEQVTGLPMQFLFDTSGALVAKDHHITPAKIRELVASEPHFLAAGRTYKKHKAEADALKKTKAYGQILKKLEKDLKGEGDAATEAKYLTERIRAYATKQLESAKAAEADDAFVAQQTYSDLAANYKGEDVGNQASARLKELKTDKSFQEELKAATAYQQILVECQKLVAQGGKIDHQYGPNQKVAASVKANATALKKKYPESKAAAKLAQALETYGFKGI